MEKEYLMNVGIGIYVVLILTLFLGWYAVTQLWKSPKEDESDFRKTLKKKR